MTDHERAPLPELVARALPKGAAIVLRDYRLPARAHLAARLQSICGPRGVALFVGADPELAREIGAAGVHLPRWFTPAPASLPAGLIISASCHNERELGRAERLGADIAFLSPAFPTTSHPAASQIGAAAFRRLAAASAVPVLALGGVTAENACRLAGPNVAGLAAIGAFLD